MGKWIYQYLVSTDEKVRRLNEESPWSKGDVLLSYPGGCVLVPYSADRLEIESLNPLQFAVVDLVTNERRAVSQIDTHTFSFICKEYPIVITFVVTEVSPEGCKLLTAAAKASR